MRLSRLSLDGTSRMLSYATAGERSSPPCAEPPWQTCCVQPFFSKTTCWIASNVLLKDEAAAHSEVEPPPPLAAPPPEPLEQAQKLTTTRRSSAVVTGAGQRVWAIGLLPCSSKL